MQMSDGGQTEQRATISSFLFYSLTPINGTGNSFKFMQYIELTMPHSIKFRIFILKIKDKITPKLAYITLSCPGS
jgi:hypothetical protein